MYIHQLCFALLFVLSIAWLAHYYFSWRDALRTRRPPRQLSHYPSVTMIRPVKDLDHGVKENFEAALADSYPGELETIFVFDTPDEPAVPILRQVLEQVDPPKPGRTWRILYCGEPPQFRTGKLNAMIAGLREAGGELIAFCDSDVRIYPEALSHLVETLLEKPGTGCAFAPVVVTQKPRTLGDAGYALLLNGLYSPVVAAVAERNKAELPFVMGQAMVFTREALTAIGGLECAEGQLVDDMYLGARVRAAGLANRVAPLPVAIIQEGLTLREFWKVYVRWIMFSRSGLPARGFRVHAATPVILSWLALIAAVFSTANGWWVTAAFGCTVPLAVSWGYDNLHGHLGGAELGAVHRWASLLVLLLAPLVLVSLYLHRQVSWRGHRYALDASGRLNRQG